MYSQDELTQNSEEINDIVSSVPSWLIRWGISVIFAVIIFSMAIGWFIKYPETVSSRLTITTLETPKSIVAQTKGRLILNVQEHELVLQNQHLGYIANSANIEDIKVLKKMLSAVSDSSFNENHLINNKLKLGELQSSYNNFISNVEALNRFIIKNDVSTRNSLYTSEIARLNELKNQFNRQFYFAKEELMLLESKYKIDSVLFQSKVISRAEYEATKSKLLSLKKTINNSEINIVQNDISVIQLKRQLNQLVEEYNNSSRELRNNIEISRAQLESDIEKWEQMYSFYAPIAGTISISKFYSDLHFVDINNVVMTVIPNDSSPVGQILLPVSESGNVAVGQTVNLKVDNYPFSKYGLVRGEITDISLIPTEDVYSIKVVFPNGLVTNYNKRLPFKQLMQGSAEIITENSRLIEKLFYGLKSILNS